MKIQLKIKRIRDVSMPAYQTEGSAGMDLRAAVDPPVTLAPGERVLVPTGLIVEIPSGYEAQVRPRSGLALKHGISLVNAPGTIDSDYRGEIGVILINLGNEPFVIQHNDRIAQMVIAPVTQARIVEVNEVNETGRGSGGFGHTGK